MISLVHIVTFVITSYAVAFILSDTWYVLLVKTAHFMSSHPLLAVSFCRVSCWMHVYTNYAPADTTSWPSLQRVLCLFGKSRVFVWEVLKSLSSYCELLHLKVYSFYLVKQKCKSKDQLPVFD